MKIVSLVLVVGACTFVKARDAICGSDLGERCHMARSDQGLQDCCKVGYCKIDNGLIGICTSIIEVHPCDKTDHGCEHICDKIGDGFQCLCNEGFNLGDDQKSCVKDPCFTAQFVSKPWNNLRKYVFRTPYPVNRFPKVNIRCEMNNKTIDVKLMQKHPVFGLKDVISDKDRKVVKNGQIFTIEMVKYYVNFHHHGTYICSACSAKKNLEVGGVTWISEPRNLKPEIIGPWPKTVGIASEVRMKCQSRYGLYGTASRLKWYKMVNGSPTPVDDLDGIQVESIASKRLPSGYLIDVVKLTVKKFTSKDVGTYRCVRTNVAGMEAVEEVEVAIQAYREVTTSINIAKLPSAEDDSMKIECHVKGSEALEFGWTRIDGTRVKRPGGSSGYCKLRQYCSKEKCSLYVRNFYGRKYAGKTFICQGSNVDGEGKKHMSQKKFSIERRSPIGCPYMCKEAVDDTCFCKE